MVLVSVWCLLLESTRETKENQRDYAVAFNQQFVVGHPGNMNFGKLLRFT